jgi:hypothetical protein
MSNASKGNYYKLKTRDWLAEKGYIVDVIEKLKSQFIPATKRVIYQKKDVLGADLIAVNDHETILVNSVFSKTHVAAHVKEFKKYPAGGCRRWVVVWEIRVKEPEIIEVDK